MEFRKIALKNRNKDVVDEALVSLEDYENVVKYQWSKSVQKRKNDEKAFAIGKVDGILMSMHQFIMGKPPNDGLKIHHKNHNGLDNQRGNLHFVSPSVNSQNKKTIKGSTSNFIGVFKNKQGKFIVQQGGVRLGVFDVEIEAAKHYDKYVAIKYNGTGKINFPDEPPKNIQDVKLEDLILTRKKSNLPENINKVGKKYVACKTYRNEKFKSKSMKTVEEAVKELKNIDAKIKKLHDKYIKEHYKKPIKRNAKDQAIIIIKSGDEIHECIVDDEYWHELTLQKWWMTGDDGYAQGHMNNKHVRMHVFLLAKKETSLNLDFVDHINHNRLDNRMSNLRSATAKINNHNRKKKEGCSSEYIGVYKSGLKWAACISIKGKSKYLGLYDDEIDAAKAYNKEAKIEFKEYANLNIFND